MISDSVENDQILIFRKSDLDEKRSFACYDRAGCWKTWLSYKSVIDYSTVNNFCTPVIRFLVDLSVGEWLKIEY